MENQFIYQMDRHMYRKGFTVIEMLFVLSITIFLSSLCMTPHTRTIKEEEEIALIKAMFDEARAMAIVEKDTVKVSVSCLLYTSPSPRDRCLSRMPSSA